MPFSRQMDKLVYPYHGILLRIKRNKVLIHDSMWMNLNIVLSERSQMQKDKHSITPST